MTRVDEAVLGPALAGESPRAATDPRALARQIAAAEAAVRDRDTSPELVAVGPDVQVVADADEPLFYADSYYWLYRDNMWLRSDTPSTACTA